MLIKTSGHVEQTSEHVEANIVACSCKHLGMLKQTFGHVEANIWVVEANI
jgi:hypothetical protein